MRPTSRAQYHSIVERLVGGGVPVSVDPVPRTSNAALIAKPWCCTPATSPRKRPQSALE